MSTYKKGNQYEGEAKKILEKLGWTVEGQHRKVSYVPEFKKPRVNGKLQLRMVMVGRDIFGCDMICKRPDTKTLFVQVSTRENKSHKIKQVMAFPWSWEHDDVEIWLRAEGKKQFEIVRGPEFKLTGTTVRLKTDGSVEMVRPELEAVTA